MLCVLPVKFGVAIRVLFIANIDGDMGQWPVILLTGCCVVCWNDAVCSEDHATSVITHAPHREHIA
jgi:hypothetical protein